MASTLQYLSVRRELDYFYCKLHNGSPLSMTFTANVSSTASGQLLFNEMDRLIQSSKVHSRLHIWVVCKADENIYSLLIISMGKDWKCSSII